MEMLLLFLLGAALMLLTWSVLAKKMSFVSQRPADYDSTGPQLDLREHLKGPILCEGVIYGPLGRVTSRFVADFDASWDGNRGRMVENFRYDTGATQSREWRLELLNDGNIRAEADDVVGVGTGKQAGCSLLLNYKLKLPKDSGGHVLTATDWMYVVENGTIVNRSQFRKFGIKVAELVATMRPKEI